MRKLNLIITQHWFDEIMGGRKKIEYREIKPTTVRRYLKYIVDGREYPDWKSLCAGVDPTTAYREGRILVVPRTYGELDLAVGYRKDRDTARVEITGITLDIDRNPDGTPVLYPDGKGGAIPYGTVEYHLGEILQSGVKDF